ncbi:hypothetical protein C2845_PM13G19560 [Panicum miliaceum]|uniref:Transmembrane protein 45B-like n=1 Tax=Panicum miliaceum TaxID=4540 RepID=A0A3L6RM60_PANMI|nr:hypothetical protein C2845_PM13G19560 [Panicum miliaceum]
MGTLVGHVPGVGFLVVGLWHLYNHTRLFLLRPRSYVAPVWFPVRGARHLELILVIAGAAASILMELVVGPARHHPFDRDGAVPGDHLHNFEHASISLALLVYAAAAIRLDRARAPRRDAVAQLAAAAAFAQELMLFHLHSADHVGVEGQYHLLLQGVAAVTLAATALGVAAPPSFAVSLVQSASLVRGHGRRAVDARAPAERVLPEPRGRARAPAKALVNLQFSWYLSATVALVVVLYLRMCSLYKESRRSRSMCRWSMEMAMETIDGDDDDDKDVEAAKGAAAAARALGESRPMEVSRP